MQPLSPPAPMNQNINCKDGKSSKDGKRKDSDASGAANDAEVCLAGVVLIVVVFFVFFIYCFEYCMNAQTDLKNLTT